MATMSVVNVNFNSSPHKLNVLQQNTNSNLGERREIIILRKPQPILPQPKGYVKDNNILLTNTAKKKKGVKEIRTSPQPIAVARRNARERNRVKQVNNGFANLRQHIPNFIAAAFENHAGRGNAKKLSKVETLRMAVEYIRTLEDILASDDNESSDNVSPLSLSTSSFPSPASSSPALTTSTIMSYTYPVMSPSIEDDDLSSNSTPPPQQFIQVNNSRNFHIISTQQLYENNENVQPLGVDVNLLSDPSLIEEFTAQDLSLLQNMNGSDSLSPEMYSDSSMSPGYIDDERNCFIAVLNNKNLPDDKFKINTKMADNEGEIPLQRIKADPDYIEDSKNNMVDVIEWWEQTPQTRS